MGRTRYREVRCAPSFLPSTGVTWRFHADDVRDAAFAFSDHYLWDATSGVADPGSGRRTAVHAFYRPSAGTWSQSARMTRDAIETFSRNVHPYVYPHITSTEGLVGGMEYPMIVFVRDFDTEPRTQRVIAHEVGHMWFPMMIGSDETGYAWMDEGVNTFITVFAAEHYYPESTERAEVRDGVSDQAIDAVEEHAMGGRNHVVVTVRNDGDVLSPIRAVVTTESGGTAMAEAPASRWFGGKRLVNVEATVDGDVARVELDPERVFADVDDSDDVWTP
ncbi:MAG TPA: M1 family aminopeptidase [Gemmatimonadota bacterium]|nr:M1 family aminopeptidase [Gemmatimonadota bacterium]